MPGDFIGSLFQEIFEQFFQLFCYFTLRILLPVVTFGYVTVEPARRGTRLSIKWHGVHRTTNGKIVLDANLAGVLGLIFWLIVLAIVFGIYFLVR